MIYEHVGLQIVSDALRACGEGWWWQDDVDVDANARCQMALLLVKIKTMESMHGVGENEN